MKLRRLSGLLAILWSLQLCAKKPPAVVAPTLDQHVLQEIERKIWPAVQRHAGLFYFSNGRLADGVRDVRASQVYDLVTIVVLDNSSATSTGVTNTARKSSVAAAVTSLAGPKSPTGALANLANANNTQLQGQGTTSRGTTLSTTMTAEVTVVLPNGNLVVEGRKEILVNSEKEVITLRGSFVRRISVLLIRFLRVTWRESKFSSTARASLTMLSNAPSSYTACCWDFCPSKRMNLRILVCLLALAPLDAATDGTRLKDLVSIEGVRDNQLVGYGIVVGLNGTGDSRQTVFSAQSLTNLLARMGVEVSPSLILVRNTAAVLVTADLPPFAQPGTRIDVSVAAVGDSGNLQGGLLVLTPLKAADGQIYAVGQGSVITGGFVAGRGGNTKGLNHPTAGRIPDGAIVEKLRPPLLRRVMSNCSCTERILLPRAGSRRRSTHVRDRGLPSREG